MPTLVRYLVALALSTPIPRPALWCDLTPGPFAVGYRNEWAPDPSRTWRTTRRAGHPFTPDSTGRPVRISIWYPATRTPNSHQMRLGDYTRIPAPAEFADFAHRLAARDSSELSSDVPPTELAPLLALPMLAFHQAPAAPGRFPLVLVMGGLNAASTDQAVLAEFLASYGYVVAVVGWTGVNETQFDAVRTQPGIEASVRDVEFAWSHLRARPNVDPTRLAVMGHSLGGLIALLTAMRNDNVGAVIGFDATYGFATSADVLTSYYAFAPRAMKAALLDIRKAAGEQGVENDLRAEHAMIYSDRTFVTLRHIRHSEFSTYSLISTATHQPPIPPEHQTRGWTRQTASDAYQHAIELSRDFLDAKLKGDPTALTRLAADVASSPGAIMTTEPALPIPPLPPSPAALIALAKSNGFDSAAHLAVDASALNSLGYELMSAKHFDDALTAFQLVVHASPTSANAYDSYGDGLAAAGQPTDACAAYTRALALAPTDSTLSNADRAEIVRAETDRVKHCQTSP
jgi:dienelactone hydrolase